MIPDRFRAIIVEQQGETHAARLGDASVSSLPDRDVLVAVAYSSLNYKDGLAVTGRGRVIRSYPMVPGIDLAGVVAESRSPAWNVGDRVIATGWGLGERSWGGFAELARVDATWLTPLPDTLTLEEAMGFGTAGLTAMLCLLALEDHGVRPGGLPVAVTGASGGVGSIATALLARAGYPVATSTGRPALHDYLRGLGAREVVARDELAAPSGRALERERWAGAVDTVGGPTLASLLRSTAHGGCVAACGLAGGDRLETTVFPFILRGVTLAGIDSVACPAERRELAWRRLAADMPRPLLAQITRVAKLDEVLALGEEILAGRVRGRIAVEVLGEERAARLAAG